MLIAAGGMGYITIHAIVSGAVLSSNDVTVTSEVPSDVTIAISLESRIPPTDYAAPLTVEIRPHNSLVPLTTITTTSNTAGVATLGIVSSSQVPPGMYDIAVKGESYLRKVFPNQSFDGPIQKNFDLSAIPLLAGDVNPTSDEYVNSLDVSYITRELYSSDQRADITHDGIVNSLDITALLKNLYQHGDN